MAYFDDPVRMIEVELAEVKRRMAKAPTGMTITLDWNNPIFVYGYTTYPVSGSAFSSIGASMLEKDPFYDMNHPPPPKEFDDPDVPHCIHCNRMYAIGMTICNGCGADLPKEKSE